MKYKYITDNNLENIQNYMYSEFMGVTFVEEYFHSRLPYLQMKPCANSIIVALQKLFQENTLNHKCYLSLKNMCQDIWDHTSEFPIRQVNVFQKRFEVKKRLFSSYINSTSIKNIGTDYNDLTPYLLLSYILSAAFQKTGSLSYLSTFLKINDTLLSLVENMSIVQHDVLLFLVRTEVKNVMKLCRELEEYRRS